MPNFKTHRKMNYIILLSLVFLYLYFGLEKYLPFVMNERIVMAFFVAYFLGTELFTPDIDTNSTPSKRLGIIYLPIRLLYPHRGRLHNPFLGWIIQISYLMLIVIIILIIVNKFGYNLDLSINTDYMVGFLIGISLSNIMHIIVDNIFEI